MIPKTIYQTWYKKNVPSGIKEVVDEFLLKNPDYDYKFYDDEDIFYFIKENYDKSTLKAYNDLQIGASKADFWRYLVLYKCGGVYLDIDAVLYRDLDDLIREDDVAIITREGNTNLFVQWCLMFDKGHFFLEKTIERCERNILERIHHHTLHATGPNAYSHIIHESFRKLREMFGIENLHTYHATDEQISESLLKYADLYYEKTGENIKCRFYKKDYGDFLHFKNKNAAQLYIEVPNWLHDPRGMYK